MPNTHTTLTSLFDDVADAIREKTGSNATIVADDFPTAIANIPVGPPDGKIWTTVEIPMSAWGRGARFHITDIAYGNGKYVILVNNNYGGGYGESDPTKLLYSSDLTNWTTVTLENHYDSIAFGKGIFLLVESGGDEVSARIAYSSDLINWTYTRTTGVSSDEFEPWCDVRYTNGLFIVVGQSGTNAVSTDLATWNYIYGSYTVTNYSAMDDGRCIDAYDGTNECYFYNIQQINPQLTLIGSHEFEVTSGRSYYGWIASFCGNGKYALVLSEYEYETSVPIYYHRIFSTSDGTNWNDISVKMGNVYDGALAAGTYGNGKYILLVPAPNNQYNLLISTDCINWEVVTNAPKMTKMIYGNGAFCGIDNDYTEGAGSSNMTRIYYSRTTNDY